MSTRKNTRRENSPQPLPKYAWPKPGADLPRLAWPDWLRLVALQIATDYHGPEGQFLSAHIIALAEHARVLGATDPESHERLAQEAADAEAAWQQALEHEAMSPGIWSLTDPDPDDVEGWGGHPQGLCDDQASRYWVADDPNDEVYLN